MSQGTITTAGKPTVFAPLPSRPPAPPPTAVPRDLAPAELLAALNQLNGWYFGLLRQMRELSAQISHPAALAGRPLTRKEACEYLQIGPFQLKKLCKRREVAFFKSGKGRSAQVLFRLRDLDDYIERHTTKAAAQGGTPAQFRRFAGRKAA